MDTLIALVCHSGIELEPSTIGDTIIVLLRRTQISDPSSLYLVVVINKKEYQEFVQTAS
jgi:hypothetical protein